MVVLEIGADYSAQMVFYKDNDVIGALAANAIVKPLDVGVLPGTVVCRNHFIDAHVLLCGEANRRRYCRGLEEGAGVSCPKERLRQFIALSKQPLVLQ